MGRKLRWHMSRKYETRIAGQDKEISFIDVSIAQESDFGHEYSLEQLAHMGSDNRAWWQEDEDEQLEGRATEEALKGALVRGNILSGTVSARIAKAERKIEEDMVFLQEVRDDNRLGEVWGRLKEKAESGLPDVSDLILIDAASWLDFTQQARKMASSTYRRALGEEEGGHDTEQRA